ncbi:protein of unknown function [Xenorhabdus poinarii G6]|uniref:Uncharacterized protein n=1 Tax=Xenorhabdus poinarii G6 TaxID=1354304 RepID=A0A068R0D1_9GAMM|nr:protein of unknown function [Xenorhabdus poinarii G6]
MFIYFKVKKYTNEILISLYY